MAPLVVHSTPPPAVAGGATILETLSEDVDDGDILAAVPSVRTLRSESVAVTAVVAKLEEKRNSLTRNMLSKVSKLTGVFSSFFCLLEFVVSMFLNSTMKCAPTSTPTYHARTGTLQNPGASDQDLLAEPATIATESNPRHGKRRSLSEEVLSVRQAPIASYGHLFRLKLNSF
jgi:hypothetical protein